ncbi:Bug family tripartite tricarboxylate transporter substrate binding protein [Neoroseomonas oryzicola]|uniref:Tripartite tricarboxylate transporter substrate binding protein n=1 Tax=Neoroseomonas oryzicola TaxID=535904 RepID=A0A9X9WMM1_9PROT|nr:tripartite tricarboxylate transporter substrate binding protein [Neoroseomonas oryzicola]MBR0661581.1 tripartite tricarboxylate transporter substrate binding protein [Neoroseomonas oryzicola]NKE16925.1 tripartite tricarboxylate transporter substrate binding protein [Neoroseomonas oryzicola]
MTLRLPRRALIAAATLPLARPALAQDAFPNRPLRMLVGFTPGGAVDISARSFTPKMGDALGQPVIVDNRPGAGSNIATEAAARSPADGHTMLLATLGALVVSPMVMRLAFDPQRDLAPVSIAVDLFNILVVPADRPWRSTAELIAAAKAAPGRLSYGTSGIAGSPHLAGVLFDRMAGIETVPVHYRGGALIATDLLSGRIDFSFATAPSVLPHVQSGRLRALAVPTIQRSRLLPEVPTVAESGVPGFDVPGWYAVVVPRGTPEPAIARLNAAMRVALEDAEVTATLNRNGLEPMPTTPAQFAAAWEAERAKWEPIIRESGIRIE